jgi:hypothetical protein
MHAFQPNYRCLPLVLTHCALLLLPLLVSLLQGFAGLQVQQPMARQLLGATLQQQQIYDPMTIDVSKLNSIFVQRQQPGLTGALIRPM